MNLPIQEKIPCICGCGTLIDKYGYNPKYKNGFYINRYTLGHVNKGKSNTWKIQETVKVRRSRERAVEHFLKNKLPFICAVNDAWCTKNLHIHHIDKNPFNNSPENLMCLCSRHHKIIDRRNCTLEDLNNLSIYINRNGVPRPRKKVPYFEIERKCKFCKKSFLPDSERRVFCTPKCKIEAYHNSEGYQKFKEYRKKWQKEHYNYVKKGMPTGIIGVEKGAND